MTGEGIISHDALSGRATTNILCGSGFINIRFGA